MSTFGENIRIPSPVLLNITPATFYSMFYKLIRTTLLIPLACFVLIQQARAQSPSGADTLKLTIKQAETMFLQNNLQLIAQHYNIDIANAQVITAKLLPNPDFSLSNGILGSEEPNPTNEQSASISQLITTAGKRNKNIQLQKIGVEQAKDQFFDLIRTLKFELRSDFYSVYYQRQSEKVYDLEISSLTKTFNAYKEQYTKGNIAEKEVIRIQSQLYSLQVEYNALEVGIDTVESQLKLLLKVPAQTGIQPVATEDITGKDVLTGVPYQQLLDSAYVNRYDLKNSKTTVDYNNMNLSLQKANAVPDFSLSVNYDKLGSYGTNFVSAGIEFNIPLFDRNQGNIKQARAQVDQSKVQLQTQQNQVESDVAVNYKVAMKFEKLANSFDPNFKQDFTHLIEEVYKQYMQRNMGMLDFLDFYDSYKTNAVQFNSLLLSRVTALEQLNYVTGTAFFNQ